MPNTIVPANDNRPLRPRDWYIAPGILVVPDEPPRIVAVAFFLGQSKSWLRCLPPQHNDVVARRKVGRRFARLA
jgi:hypothetical protein